MSEPRFTSGSPMATTLSHCSAPSLWKLKAVEAHETRPLFVIGILQHIDPANRPPSIPCLESNKKDDKQPATMVNSQGRKVNDHYYHYQQLKVSHLAMLILERLGVGVAQPLFLEKKCVSDKQISSRHATQ